MTFKKGVSGNPAGRPKQLWIEKQIKIKALAISMEGMEFLERVIKDEGEPTKIRLLALAMALDRGLGKPKQELSIIEDDEHANPFTMTTAQLRLMMEGKSTEAIVSMHKSGTLDKILDGVIVEESK